jgi:hypothetical protein
VVAETDVGIVVAFSEREIGDESRPVVVLAHSGLERSALADALRRLAVEAETYQPEESRA